MLYKVIINKIIFLYKFPYLRVENIKYRHYSQQMNHL